MISNQKNYPWLSFYDQSLADNQNLLKLLSIENVTFLVVFSKEVLARRVTVKGQYFNIVC